MNDEMVLVPREALIKMCDGHNHDCAVQRSNANFCDCGCVEFEKIVWRLLDAPAPRVVEPGDVVIPAAVVKVIGEGARSFGLHIGARATACAGSFAETRDVPQAAVDALAATIRDDQHDKC